MRYLIMMIIIALTTTGCYTHKQIPSCSAAFHLRSSTQVAENFFNHQSIEYKSHEFYPAKNPKKVLVVNDAEKLTAPYRIIGIGKISKFSLLGNKRDKEKLNEMIKKLAARIGGDAVIAHSHDEIFEAQIVAYQKILI